MGSNIVLVFIIIGGHFWPKILSCWNYICLVCSSSRQPKLVEMYMTLRVFVGSIHQYATIFMLFIINNPIIITLLIGEHEPCGYHGSNLRKKDCTTSLCPLQDLGSQILLEAILYMVKIHSIKIYWKWSVFLYLHALAQL